MTGLSAKGSPDPTGAIRLRRALSQAPLLLVAFDDQGIVRLSEGQSLPAPFDDARALPGRSFQELFSPAGPLASSFQQVLDGKLTRSVIELEKGTFEVLFSLLPADQGDPPGALCLILDISGRRRMEATLRDSEQRFLRAFSHAAIGMALLGIDERFTRVNEALCQMVGQDEAELLSKGLGSLTHPKDGDHPGRYLQQLLSGERQRCHIERRLLHKDGRTLWAMISLSLIRDDQDRPLYFFAQFQDVTEWKKSEAVLRESEARYRATFEATGTATVIIEEDTTLAMVNEEFVALSGYAREELEGQKSWTDFAAPADLERMQSYHWLRRQDPSSAPATYEFDFIDRQGQTRRILLTIALIPDTRRSVASLLDITQRQQVEEALRASEEKYRLVVENADEAIVVAQDGYLKFANPKALELTGYDRDEIHAIPFPDLIHPDDREMVLERHQKRLQGEMLNNVYPFRILTKGELDRWVQINAVLLTWEGRPATLNFLTDITERVHSEQALQHIAERLKLLRRIDRAILAAESPVEIARSALAQIQDLVDYRRSSILIFDEERQEARILATQSQQDVGVAPGSTLPLSYFTRQGQLAAGEIQVIPDIAQLPSERPLVRMMRAAGIEAVLTVPLIAEGQLIGILNLGCDSPTVFTESQIEIAREIAGPLSVAIQQARLYEKVQEHAEALQSRVTALQDSERYLGLLNEITNVAIGTGELPEMIEVLAQRMGELLNADGCGLVLCQAPRKPCTLAAAYGSIPTADSDSTANQALVRVAQRVLESPAPMVIPDVHKEPVVDPEIARSFPGKSLLGLPLATGDRRLGVTLITFDAPHVFTQMEVARGEQAAGQVALALARAQLLEAERQRRQEAETLRAVSNALISTLDLQQVLNLILEQLAEVIEFDSASVMLYKETHIEAVAGWGFREEDRVIGQHFPTDNPFFRRILHTHQALWLDEPRDDPQFAGWGGTKAIRSWMALPMIARGNFIGYVTLDSYKPGAYGPDQAALVQPFANQAAQAIENAQLFDWVQKQAVTDSLTGLYNRRGLFDLGQREVERARRFGRSLSAIMLDIDLFKQVNDRHGHYIGDQVLQALALRCQEVLRSVDVLGRYGGEEFAILLPETKLEKARQVAERLRGRIADEPIDTERGSLAITISLGVTQMTDQTRDLAILLDAADSGMYQAKQDGRNCVRTYP